MRKTITRRFVAVLASAALGILGVAGAGALSTAAGAVGAAKTPAGEVSGTPAPGSQLWEARYNGPINGYDVASSVAVSPTGGRVFVTGRSEGPTKTSDFLTIAYNAATGARLWGSRYNGPASSEDMPRSMALSPTGGTVFVTGLSLDADDTSGYVTIAYNATTGARLWVTRYSTGGQGAQAASVAVSPSGAMVYVTGSGDGPHGLDYATIAYDAATGAQAWVSRYNGPAGQDDSASSVAVSPTGGRLFVTGSSSRANGDHDYATVAYNAATGAQLWVTRYGTPASDNGAGVVAISPSGGRVFVTGNSFRAYQYDYATVAYKATTGAQVWAKRYNGPGDGEDIPHAMAVSPNGGKVFVTGHSVAGPGVVDYATIAYDTATGAQVWVKRHHGSAQSLAVSRTGRTVFVTGQMLGNAKILHRNYGTIAYRASTGKWLWTTRYDGPANQDDAATAVAVSPTGGRVFVTGYSWGTGTRADYATLAYKG